jgi:hypothetical protein
MQPLARGLTGRAASAARSVGAAAAAAAAAASPRRHGGGLAAAARRVSTQAPPAAPRAAAAPAQSQLDSDAVSAAGLPLPADAADGGGGAPPSPHDISGEALPGRAAYLDLQATTPLDPRVLDAMLPFYVQRYGNPHSRTHVYGWEAEAAVEAARAQGACRGQLRRRAPAPMPAARAARARPAPRRATHARLSSPCARVWLQSPRSSAPTPRRSSSPAAPPNQTTWPSRVWLGSTGACARARCRHAAPP